ncbi:MAG TPA: XRE family transcriptional regulator [Clostridiales bacterium]|nr:XRE family transcriptional regulator [Clostridiales bacterium]
MNLGEKIKSIREQKGLRQKDLAVKSCMSNTYLSDIEVGRSLPSFRTLEKIASALDVDMKELF